jgi:hypothetical protein
VGLTGPWVGGGSNVDIEFEGGMKLGERVSDVVAAY